MRCFSSQTRRAASNKLFVRVSVPTAGRSLGELLSRLAFFRGRPLRAFLELTTRLVPPMEACPTLFIISRKHLLDQSGKARVRRRSVRSLTRVTESPPI